MPEVTEIVFTAAGPRDRRSGLLGWVACVIDDTLRLDGLALRRTRDGRLALSYPFRTDRWGNAHYAVRPINEERRREFEGVIFEALALEVGA